ncbi:protein translocase subunit SecD [Bartonella sp. DGB1]|uniref:protein translocase subunit SecD n=1 Tax=Bartonella sp. DGB1 TaxID=3239807 RepID=UPI0035262E23
MRTPRWLIIFYSIIIAIGVFLTIPNFFSKDELKNISWLPNSQITLGLDLQGGSYLMLSIDKETMIRDQLRPILTEIRQHLNSENIITPSIRIINGEIIVTPRKISQLNDIIKSLNNFDQAQSNVDTKRINVINDKEKIIIELSDTYIKNLLANAITQSMEIIRQRVDQVGVAEPAIQKIGNDQIMVQLPGLKDPTQLRELLGSTAKMTFHLLANENDEKNGNILIIEDAKNPEIKYKLVAQAALDGSHLLDAKSTFDSQTNKPIISFRLDSEGTKTFARITQHNIGRPFAIVLDNKVLTAPTIQTAILGGSGQISGNFTIEETVTLSALLRAGALPVPLIVVEERSVGPDLGADSIKRGFYTGVIGFLLVAAFIIILYGFWGLVANFALLLHTILTLSALTILGATLTLPGIAGIILGIGIAVDANILINERIKEETRKGMSAFAALDRGFNSAFSTIVDANVTALIATALLFWFGTGPVRGFAVTMFLSIIISMFTAVTIVRIIMQWLVKRKKYKTLEIKPLINMNIIKSNIKFMNIRYWGISISLILSIIASILFIKPGLNYGIDFIGGIQIEAKSTHTLPLADIRNKLTQLQLGEITLQNIDGDKNILIKVQKQDGSEIAQTNALELVKKTLLDNYPALTFEKTEVVGPKISESLTTSGLIAVSLAMLFMCLYIWWRFEWFFAFGAIITLILDITKMIGFFVIFKIDFNLTAIAALLTIIGYSINDKVVVYDRMRENLRLYKKMPLREIIDLSINQVFVRCIFTSVTTCLAMLPMAIYGGNAVYNFAVPMLAGIIIATISSILIAAPIMMLLGNWWKKYNSQTAGEQK